MKAKIYPIALLLCIATAFSCGTRTDEVSQPKETTPAALQESKLSLSSYSRSADLVDDLYAELIVNNPALKRVEDDLVVVRTNSDELTYLFNTFDNKSNSYYNAAISKIANIKDSELKKRMVALIANSKSHYAGQKDEIGLLVAQISQSNATISDYYDVMKIALTLPLIEKYQKEKIPEQQPYHGILKEQGNLINRIDSIKPQ